MSGVSVKENLIEGVFNHSMSDPSMINVIKEYFDFILSMYGPNGSLTLIQNSVENEILTSSSNVLLQQVKFFHPVIKFINAYIESQNAAFGTFGSYVGILMSGIMSKLYDLESAGISFSAINNIMDYILNEVVEYLESCPQNIIHEVDISNMSSMSNFVNCILFSKPMYCISPQEKQNLTLLMLKSFFKTIPSESNYSSFGKINIKTVDISSLLDSSVYDGVLYANPSVTFSELYKTLENNKSANIILFNVPLAFEKDKHVVYEWDGMQDYPKVFLNELLKDLIPSLKQREVDILCNQKIIDPLIKYELEKNGIIALERLGTTLTNNLANMTKCQPIVKLDYLKESIELTTIGIVSTNVHTIGDAEYLGFNTDQCSNVTITIPGNDIQFENFIENSIESCSSSLRLLVQDPKVVPGSGCLETILASFVYQLMCDKTETIAEMCDVKTNEVMQVSRAIISTFLTIAGQMTSGKPNLFDRLVDNLYGHFWIEGSDGTCNCGLIKNIFHDTNFIEFKELQDLSFQNQIPMNISKSIQNGRKNSMDKTSIDLCCAKLNAVKLSCEGLTQLMKIGYCIFDK